MQRGLELIISFWEHLRGNCNYLQTTSAELSCGDVDNESHRCEYIHCPTVEDWKEYLRRDKPKKARCQNGKSD